MLGLQAVFFYLFALVAVGSLDLDPWDLRA